MLVCIRTRLLSDRSALVLFSETGAFARWRTRLQPGLRERRAHHPSARCRARRSSRGSGAQRRCVLAGSLKHHSARELRRAVGGRCDVLTSTCGAPAPPRRERTRDAVSRRHDDRRRRKITEQQSAAADRNGGPGPASRPSLGPTSSDRATRHGLPCADADPARRAAFHWVEHRARSARTSLRTARAHPEPRAGWRGRARKARACSVRCRPGSPPAPGGLVRSR
jgi:hypothetical protein